MPVLNGDRLIDVLVDRIRRDNPNGGGELDLSGGIDSAVMLGLLVLAYGPEKVTIAHLRFSTNPEQTDRAEELALALGFQGLPGTEDDEDYSDVYDLALTKILRGLERCGYNMAEIQANIERDPTILGSFRSCLRAPLGRIHGRLTLCKRRYGTGNEDEDRFIRFFQKGGDGEVDNNPIAILSKGEVYQLALALGRRFGERGVAVFKTIIGAMPSADLWGNGDKHNDESEIKNWLGAPFTYTRIDPETGNAYQIGTIERVNRLLDTDLPMDFLFSLPSATVEALALGPIGMTYGSVLFKDNVTPEVLDKMITQAASEPVFAGFSPSEVRTFLLAARHAEAQTRHKWNPNCPSLGSRSELVRLGILSNDLGAYNQVKIETPVLA